MTTTKLLPEGMQLCSSPRGEVNSPSLNALLTMTPLLSVTDQDSLPITFDQLLNEPDLSTLVEPVYGLYQKEIEVSKKQQEEKDGVNYNEDGGNKETQDHVLKSPKNPNESSKVLDQNDVKEARNEALENLDEKYTVSEHDSVECNDTQQNINTEVVENPNDIKEPSNEDLLKDVSVDKNDMDQDRKFEGVEDPNDHMQETRNEDPPQKVEDLQQDVANPAEDPQQVRNQEPQELNLDLNNERLWPSLGVSGPMIGAQRIRPGSRM